MNDDDPFKWNGTYLGEISDENIKNRFYYSSFEYWIVALDRYLTTCMVKKTKHYTTCLVDELKPIFGLNKLGTHYCKYKTSYAILIRARTNLTGDLIISDTLLSSCVNILDSGIIEQIKRIYIFRDLLCLTKSTDSSIALRINDKLNSVVYPISMIDSNIKLERLTDLTISTYLSEIIFSRWIKDESPSLILCKMCNVFDKNKIITRIFKLKQDITDITRRVCGSDFMDFPDVLTNRILAKLQYAVKTK